MGRTHELERDRQVAEMRAVLSGATRRDGARDIDSVEPAVAEHTEPDDGEVDVVTLDGLGDGYDPPATAWRARLARQRGSVGVFLAVAVLTAAATMLVTWLLRPTDVPTPAPAAPADQIAAGDERDDLSAAPSPSVSPEQEAPPELIVVAVVGRVQSPGLVTLPAGSRVSDAIAAAGGALPDTDLSTINIARKVSDGEQISVGVPPAADAGGDGAGAPEPGKVNLNSASAQQLEELPGVGPVLAQSIVDFRDQNGPFGAVGDLINVSGIGPATLAELADLVTV